MKGPIFLKVGGGNLNSGIPPAILKHAIIISSHFFKPTSLLTPVHVPTENQSIALLRPAPCESCDIEQLTHSEPFGDPITEIISRSLTTSSSLPPFSEGVSIPQNANQFPAKAFGSWLARFCTTQKKSTGSPYQGPLMTSHLSRPPTTHFSRENAIPIQ